MSLSKLLKNVLSLSLKGSLFLLPRSDFITFSTIHKTISFAVTILNLVSEIKETDFNQISHLFFITSMETMNEIIKTIIHFQKNLNQGYLRFNHNQKESFWHSKSSSFLWFSSLRLICLEFCELSVLSLCLCLPPTWTFSLFN